MLVRIPNPSIAPFACLLYHDYLIVWKSSQTPSLALCVYSDLSRTTCLRRIMRRTCPRGVNDHYNVTTIFQAFVSGHLRPVSQDKIKFLFFIKRNRV